MLSNLFRMLHRRRASAQELIVPGILTIGLVCLLRLSALLQSQEWMTLDTFSRYCLVQTHPVRITLVTVDEQDYQTTGFPLSSDILAKALTNLQAYQPRVIGLDIFRDLPQEKGQDMLQEILAMTTNDVAAEVAFDTEPMMRVQAPQGVPTGQIGFADVAVDSDGKLRRIVLRSEREHSTIEQTVSRESFSLKLAKQYLSAQGVEADIALLPRFYANSGGYVRAEAGGAIGNTQMLLNFCMLQQPYDTLSLREVLSGDIDADKLRDRIVIIGKRATQSKDSFITSAARQTLYSQQVANRPHPTKIIYGIEVHAHATEQIIGTLLGNNCALYTWNETTEYLWIVVWGVVGMAVSVLLRSPWKSVVVLIVMTLLLNLLSYWLLTQTWWIPVVPAVLSLCSAGLITAFFDREMRSELIQRQMTIDRTYEAVHSGPLQKLADISRSVKALPPASNEQLQQQLAALNSDMRNIFTQMRQDAVSQRYSLYLDESTLLDLRTPLSDLLYQVYEHSIHQPLPGFEKIQIYVPPVFEVLDGVFEDRRFGMAAKRGLCLFLQEALLNVGNHAIGATRLDVICLSESVVYRLQIIDNGMSSVVDVGRRSDRRLARRLASRQGTRQAAMIAQQLGGKFRRSVGHFSPLHSSPLRNLERTAVQQGTLCEIVWPK